jgi:hypothetical protein
MQIVDNNSFFASLDIDISEYSGFLLGYIDYI